MNSPKQEVTKMWVHVKILGIELIGKRDRITVTPEGLGEAYETKIKSFFDE